MSSLRGVVTDPAARGLIDDAAVLEVSGTKLVLTHDMIVEGVHYLPSDAPEDVAWKLVAVNLSDLAAKGAGPLGLIAGYCLAGDADWDDRFVRGLGEAARTFAAPLLGGDTVAVPEGSARVLGLTAIGSAAHAPARNGARPGNLVWVTGTIGDAGAGLDIAAGRLEGPGGLAERYRRPMPRLAAGQALAPHVDAMMDVSDGLLIDASRMAEASGAAFVVDFARIPLSGDFEIALGNDRPARLRAATAGDDYELLFAAPPEKSEEIGRIADRLGLLMTMIGEVREGLGLRLVENGEEIPLPSRLGYEHGA
ncbi:thiamine-phosphate kinase [Allosphingosinicella flava]|uniref:Thiamine-monophosphate kinase n=1 Tax=Allosphingosinicella flava TaxID=2771430 RepID=A0A7T2GM40_9SPHN|nr:thiamine-phosphate kinase [Sphingosinicella flava]QPQ56312.1 thiamine-phosphate kinase [Sphingosinicella flava]